MAPSTGRPVHVHPVTREHDRLSTVSGMRFEQREYYIFIIFSIHYKPIVLWHHEAMPTFENKIFVEPGGLMSEYLIRETVDPQAGVLEKLHITEARIAHSTEEDFRFLQLQGVIGA